MSGSDDDADFETVEVVYGELMKIEKAGNGWSIEVDARDYEPPPNFDPKRWMRSVGDRVKMRVVNGIRVISMETV